MLTYVLAVLFLLQPAQPINIAQFSTSAACKEAETLMDASPQMQSEQARKAGATALCLVVAVPENEHT